MTVYKGIDKPEPIVWKTRLRCALNKMPDIRELPEMSRLDISDPYRVYELLPPMHKGNFRKYDLNKRTKPCWWIFSPYNFDITAKCDQSIFCIERKTKY